MRVSNDKLPGHALALSLQKVWEIIRDQKDLNLPAHKVCFPSLQAASCPLACSIPNLYCKEGRQEAVACRPDFLKEPL